MIQNKTLSDIHELVLSRQLGKSLNSLENYLLANSPSDSRGQVGSLRQADMEQLMGIHDDYRLMTEYWQRGYDDPKREEVYDRLLRRAYVFTANLQIHWQLSNSAFLKATHLRPRKIRKDWSMSAVRASMETFVSDVTLLQLESGDRRREQEEQLYPRHWELMRDLFDYIFTSHQWRDSLADVFIDLLLSPTIDSNDQQLLVSAITLSALQNFCFQKFRVLTEVYRQSSDEQVRQRALAGWVLIADGRPARLYTEMYELIGRLCDSEQVRQELSELQMQLFYCLQADADTNTIQKEILPDIISGSKLRLTTRGLAEMDEDSLEDILHPEASELAMERMEQSMQRMADMQRQGADIYFGGFSQMKRFPFFNDVSNWFVPFYSQHPAVSQTWNNSRGKKFLQAITHLGAFCDSDKYSFVLAFNQVLDRLPQNILKMVEQGEATAMPIGGEAPAEEQRQPAFMRRIYLQNLYRFFRLYSMRSEFCNPFDADAAPGRLLFFANPLFSCSEMGPQFLAVASFLLKRRQYEQVVSVLTNMPKEQRGLQFYMMLGTALQHTPQLAQFSAQECFRQALQLQPDNERALSGLARALFGSQAYEEAYESYSTLLSRQPEHKTYQLNTAVCLLHLGRAGEALKLLYKLSYIYPDDLTVSRVHAWALTVGGKYEQADKIYCQLLALPEPQPADMLNYGYCLWLSHNMVTAIGMFRQFLSSQTDDTFSIQEEFMCGGRQLLADAGITDTEIRLMTDAVVQ